MHRLFSQYAGTRGTTKVPVHNMHLEPGQREVRSVAGGDTLPRLRLLQFNLHSRNGMPQRTARLPIGALASVV